MPGASPSNRVKRVKRGRARIGRVRMVERGRVHRVRRGGVRRIKRAQAGLAVYAICVFSFVYCQNCIFSLEIFEVGIECWSFLV